MTEPRGRAGKTSLIDLAISLAVILVTLPLLRRMTGPAGMRFE